MAFTFPYAWSYLAPAEPNGYANRGYAYLAKQDVDRAITDFSEAIRLGMKDAVTYSFRANAYAAKQDYRRAIADVTEAIALQPKNVPLYLNRFVYHTALKNFGLALADCDEGHCAPRPRMPTSITTVAPCMPNGRITSALWQISIRLSTSLRSIPLLITTGEMLIWLARTMSVPSQTSKMQSG